MFVVFLKFLFCVWKVFVFTFGFNVAALCVLDSEGFELSEMTQKLLAGSHDKNYLLFKEKKIILSHDSFW